jgi:hypothetical protein
MSHRTSSMERMEASRSGRFALAAQWWLASTAHAQR